MNHGRFIRLGLRVHGSTSEGGRDNDEKTKLVKQKYKSACQSHLGNWSLDPGVKKKSHISI